MSRSCALLWLFLCAGLASLVRVPDEATIEGRVVDAAGPVAQARVGWQGERLRVVTDARGGFRLPRRNGKRLIASKPGCRIASSESTTPLRLDPMPTIDHDDYAWIDPHPDSGSPSNCANCHAEIHREWQASAHARSATNAKFVQLYAGPHKRWNARGEHPDGSAVCAACHAPTLKSVTLDYDVREADGVAKSGIHCDYCHKVADVTDKLGLRFGRDALFSLRPAPGDALTFGPLDDAVRAGESFAHAPIYKDSRYCAACHEGTVFGVHAYGTYSEWLESPAKQQGKHCQDCHMAPTGRMTNIAPGKGGIERNPRTLASHRTPGGELKMLASTLSLNVQRKATARGIEVRVEVVSSNVGHRVPTGFPDRQLVLVVDAFDADGNRVEPLEGPRLPASVGEWSALPGMLYAKQLTGERRRTPIPYWLPVFDMLDTRLHPNRPDRRAFVFPASVERVTVRLWYRRFWHEVAAARGWKDNDVLVAESVPSKP